MNSASIRLRSVARRMGVPAVISWLRGTRPYEDRFGAALLNSVRPGDVVWDVGANVGYYSTRLAERAGPSGSVIAVEPMPACAEQIRERTNAEGFTNVRIVNAALGIENGSATMLLASEDLAATHRIVSQPADGNGRVLEVQVWSGDSLRQEMNLPCPNVLKIDVEGFEQECLQGMSNMLSDPRLRTVYIEVHFGILARRGKEFAPMEIEKNLVQCGFKKRKWIDASHLAGYR